MRVGENRGGFADSLLKYLDWKPHSRTGPLAIDVAAQVTLLQH
jgi:hypothetical protein